MSAREEVPDQNPDDRDRERVDVEFTYHPPVTQADAAAHEGVNGLFRSTALEVVDIIPPGRERSLVLTKLQEARMWANAGLAVARAKSERARKRRES